MINGELIVDNFAGGGGADTEHEDSGRQQWPDEICIGKRQVKHRFSEVRIWERKKF